MQLHRDLMQTFVVAFWVDAQMHLGKAHYKESKEKIQNFFLIEDRHSYSATAAGVELACPWKALKVEFSDSNGLVIASKRDLLHYQASFVCHQSTGWGNT